MTFPKNFSNIFNNLFLKLTTILLLILVGAAAFLYWWASQPAQPVATDNIKIVIKPGSGASQIGEQLQSANLIRSSLFFQFLVWQNDLTGKLQAGSFDLSPADSPKTIAENLTKGTDDVWITIKEGWRAGEIGDYLANSLPNFDSDGDEFETECLNHEGYLYPETYLVPLNFNTTQTCKLLRNHYEKIAQENLRDQTYRSPLNEKEIIILASIIEREAKKPADMAMVSGILHNRLELGMPLQVDATLQYAKGYDAENNTWWPAPTATDKQLDSPYNTYQQPGLPAGPISNPGLNAITAAANPTTTDNLYYISNLSGTQMYYAKTYDQHQQNIDQYLK